MTFPATVSGTRRAAPDILRKGVILLLAGLSTAGIRAAEPVNFSREVLPVLSANCFACHGPDEHERKAKLRLDIEAEAQRELADGFPIVPGSPEKSTLLARLTTDDPDEVMPPPMAHKTVKPEQIATLRRWIEEGAKWGRHWSFEPLVRPEVPAGAGGIDFLTHQMLAARGLSPAAPASPHTLIRRLSLDLTGLPPEPGAADAFAASPSEEAYARMVDELLASPRFGEHWARMWLDLMRYADTKGYEKDLGRTMWPWRDWVVQAFNADMPLAQFTTEQLAGDLLPGATQEQIIATACHRNTMVNDEGGTDDEEFRQAAVKDRVDSTLQVWMGLTMACAKCHTHKYDPVSQTEYYQFFALFNQTEDADRYDDSPVLAATGIADNAVREALLTQITSLTAAAAELEKPRKEALAALESLWTVPPVEHAEAAAATLTTQPDGSLLAGGPSADRETYAVTLSLPAGTWRSLRLEALPEKQDGPPGVGRNPADPNFVVSELTAGIPGRTGAIPLTNARAGFSQEGWPVAAAIDGKPETGWAVSPRKSERHAAVFDFTVPLELSAPGKLSVNISQQYGSRLTLLRFRLSVTTATAAQLTLPPAPDALTKAQADLAAARDALKKLEDSRPKVPVMRELAPGSQRVTHLHRRGNFLDPGEPVKPAVPAAFHPFPPGAPLNRLGAAQWLTSPDNPLTPRVWANRIWARLFGAGIVETEEDFGALGSPPSSQALLDWLAAEYRDGGGSLKKLLRTIVLSATYRQRSESTPAQREADPRNVYLSRGARYRLSAETVRDQALAVSGLLSVKMGGPPVMPPQPQGLWRSTYNGQKWVDAEGEDRFRRGLYTYLKRTTPYPAMTAFDGGSGEVCQIRRIRTNTPLQALVTLNDPVYLEAAAALAKRMVLGASEAPDRAALGLRLALIRPVDANETAPLVKLQRDAETAFAADPQKAASLITATRAQRPQDFPEPAFAAWIVAASAILNLDEFICRN